MPTFPSLPDSPNNALSAVGVPLLSDEFHTPHEPTSQSQPLPSRRRLSSLLWLFGHGLGGQFSREI